MDNETANKLIEAINADTAVRKLQVELDTKFMELRTKELMDAQQIESWQKAIENRDAQLTEYHEKLELANTLCGVKDDTVNGLLRELQTYKKMVFDAKLTVKE